MLTNNLAKLELAQANTPSCSTTRQNYDDPDRLSGLRRKVPAGGERGADRGGFCLAALAPRDRCAASRTRASQFAGLAIQGPKVGQLFKAVFGQEKELPARNQIARFRLGETRILVAAHRLHGEDGIRGILPRGGGTPDLA
jgi:hypothetical protein